MAERTTDEIATIFTNAGDSVTLINTLAALSSLTDEQKDTIKRNVEHLEIIKAYKKEDNTTSIWTSEDFTAQDAAVTLGKTKYWFMPRQTTEELQEELKTLQKNYEEAVQVQKNIQNRAVAINAILTDRAEEETTKKSTAK